MRIAACRTNSSHDKAANLDSALAPLKQTEHGAGLSVLAGSVHAPRPDGRCRNIRLLIDPVNRMVAAEARFAMLRV